MRNPIKAATTVALTFIFSLLPLFTSAEVWKPDFSLPETSSREAYIRMQKSLKKKKYDAALRYALDYSLADNLKTPQGFETRISLFDSLAHIMPSPYSDLSLLIEAQLFTDLLNSKGYLNISLPKTSVNTNRGINGNDFEIVYADSVRIMIDNGLNGFKETSVKLKPYAKTSVKNFNILLDLPDNKEICKIIEKEFSIYDFYCLKSANILDDVCRNITGNQIIPFFESSSLHSDPAMQYRGLRGNILDDMIKRNLKEGNSIPAAFAMIAMGNTLPYPEMSSYFYEKLIEMSKTEGFAILLESFLNYSNREENYFNGKNKKVYTLCEQWLSKYPKSPLKGIVYQSMARLSEEKIELEIPSLILPDKEFEVKIKDYNIEKCFINFYPVEKSALNTYGELDREKFDPSIKATQQLNVEFKGEIPFMTDSTLNVSGLSPGFYLVTVSRDPTEDLSSLKEDVSKTARIINFTSISYLTVQDPAQKDSNFLYIVNAATQQPLEGAKVNFYSPDKPGMLICSETSAKDGKVAAPEGFSRFESFWEENVIAGFFNNYIQFKKTFNRNFIEILTDRSVYKPGDNISFAIIAYNSDKSGNSPLTGQKVEVTLMDANYKEISSKELLTDRFGRSSGNFEIPHDRVLGTYSLSASFPKDNREDEEIEIHNGHASFEVAEFKIPTFFVTLEKDTTYSTSDTISFIGKVETYTSLPVPVSKISYNVEFVPSRFFYPVRMGRASYQGETVSDINGIFHIDLPVQNLKETDYSRGIFILTASATSITGETQTSSWQTFHLGNDLSLNADIPYKIDVSGKDSIELKVEVTDILGKEISHRVNYQLSDSKGCKIDDGVFMSPDFILPLGGIESGLYELEFTINGQTEKYNYSTIFYRSDENSVPYSTSLWIPENDLIISNDRTDTKVKFGSFYNDDWLFYMICQDGNRPETHWVKSKGELIEISVPSPGINEKKWIIVSGTHDFENKTGMIIITNRETDKKASIEIESFRDNTTAGNKEHWKFRYFPGHGSVNETPFFAVMTDKALNDIRPFRWYFSPYRYHPHISASVYGNSSYTVFTDYYFSKKILKNIPPVLPPDWNFYGYSLVGFHHRLFKEKALATGLASSRNMDYGFVIDSEAIIEEESQSGQTNEPFGKEPQMRLSELPVAFFMPSLISDEKGCVEIDFDVPDFNTTWQFQTLAYNEKLEVASLIKEITSSKPVMVRTYNPLFLRTGDDAVVRAVLINNTDAVLNIGGRALVTEKESGKILLSQEFDHTEASEKSVREISFRFKVPENVDALEIAVFAKTEGYSDGEKSIVPVFPSSTPLIESDQFYISPNQNDISLILPDYSESSQLTLKYCYNPLTECILSLPNPLNFGTETSSLSIARNLATTYLIENMLETYPLIRETLKNTQNSIGRLEDDPTLKIEGLNLSPWVNNSERETERLQSLASVYDSVSMNNLKINGFEKLKSIQNEDGGFKWFEGMTSSLYISQEILSIFGENISHVQYSLELGLLLAKAINYCDSCYLSNHKEDKDINFSTILPYLYVRGLYKNLEENPAFNEIADETIDYYKHSWKKLDITGKLYLGFIIRKNKKYSRLLEQILSSITEFAVKNETQGWYFDMNRGSSNTHALLKPEYLALKLFSEIYPDSEAVEGLRQWLLLRLETLSMAERSLTPAIVSSILSSGIVLDETLKMPQIKIGSQEISIPVKDFATGFVTINLNAKEASGNTLEINDAGPLASWGGIIDQYVLPVEEVNAFDSENLSISREIILLNDSEPSESRNGNELQVGDKVRVKIVLECRKDMDYVVIRDDRGAFLQPPEWLSGCSLAGNLWCYKETFADRSEFFIEHLPQGRHIVSYDCFVDREGKYAAGIVSVQSLFSPQNTAHSAGQYMVVTNPSRFNITLGKTVSASFLKGVSSE